jgi:hypothetical protein
MKTRKLVKRFTKKFGIRPNNSQKLESSILCLSLMNKGRAGILPAFVAIALPSFVGSEAIFSNTARASAPTDAQWQIVTSTQLGEVSGVREVSEVGGDKLIVQTPSSPSSSPTPDTSPTFPSLTPLTPSNSQTPPTGNTAPTVPSQTVTQNKVKIEIAPVGDPRVQADGRSTLQLSGQITDEKGQIIREDVIVTLTTSAGKFVGADQDKDQGGFQVRAIGGEFTATLQSDIKPQQVRIRAAIDTSRKQSPAIGRQLRILGDAPFGQQTETSVLSKFQETPIETYTQVEFTTYLRPSLVTGVVNLRIGPGGTDYWGSFRDFLNPEKIDDGTTFDFKAAVFATGKVGDWLFTGAFNSYRPINEDCEGRNRLFGSIQFCEQPYPVYGDSSTSTPTTPSIDSFYARFERTPSIVGAEPDYFMWGDYNTQEFARASQLYSATSRQLHGFKANYNLGNFQITGMYANDIEGFQRDTFVPNGTSGNYFLSKRLLVPGSETVYLEAEEINRPGTVVERKQLLRGPDYEIDYDRGTLLFRRSIFATELNPFGTTLVRRVVVTYQNEGGEDSKLYAGRLQYNFSQALETKSFFGASYLLEDQGDQDFQLYGADFLISFGNTGRIVGEFARSNNDLVTGREADGNAYRLEAIGNFGDLQASAYYRAVEPGFANNATFSFFPGQTRYGTSLLARLTETTSLTAAYDYEENYGTSPSRIVDFFDLFNPQPQTRPGESVNNELRTIRAGILQKFGPADLSLEYVNRSREDRVDDNFDGDADQLVSRLKLPLTQTLTFQAQNEQNLGDSDPLYPNRTTFGLDWKAFPGVTLRLAHQFYDDSSLLQGNSITTLDTLVDHKFSEDTTLTGRYSVLSAYNGLQGQGAVGLNHKWAIAPGLRVNVGYEYIFKNIFNATAAGPRYEQYYAIGQSASTLGLFSGSVYSVGLEYTDNPNFQASTRFEYRDGDEGNNTVISAAAAGKLTPALTALIRFQQAGEANVFLPTSAGITGVRFQELGDTSNLKIGLAYRDPSNDKFNGLLKYEWRQNYDSIPETQLTGSTATGHIFSAEGIYAPNWRWEFYGKYALRNGVTFLDGDRYDGTVNLAQLRATYKLGYRTDLAVEGRWIGQNSNNGTDYDEFGVAVETGYYLTPDLRVGVGYSFGSVDDRDFSGYRSEGGFYLNISLKLNELLRGFGLQKPVPKQQQESEVTPISQLQPETQSKTPQSKLVKRLKETQTPSATQSQKPQNKLIEHLKLTQALAVPQTKSQKSRILQLIDNLKKQQAFRGFRGGEE